MKDDAESEPKKSLVPALTLPKGGGAIRGIDEKFTASPATGTGSLAIPLSASPGRGGFAPELALRYDSGAGSGPFGIGWSLSVGAIARKTDKGLPRYAESDVFVLEGSEDLVPARDENGGLEERVDGAYRVLRFVPRVQADFASIERFTHRETFDVHWRVTTRSNLLQIYGRTPAARIADPEDARRVFAWLMEETLDDRGNVARYVYKAEDGAGVDPAQASEANRFRPSTAGPRFAATAQRYLKRVLYGNLVPQLDRERPLSESADDYLFELVLDYGEHDDARPAPTDAAPWPVRRDPFSTYRSAFEVRTYRLCRRVLVFHRFAELGSAPCLVRSSDLTYEESAAVTYLTSLTHAGYTRQDRGEGRAEYERATHPPLDLGYARAVVHDELAAIDRESLEGAPGGITHWVDLDGEGIPGALISTPRAWWYKRNRGGGRLDPPRLLKSMPSPASLEGGVQQLMDLGSDGRLDLVQYRPPLAGYFERTPDGDWAPFAAFGELPNLDWSDPGVRFVDLDGDGLPDVLVTEDQAFAVYRSRGKQGFEPATRVTRATREADGPAVVFTDRSETIHLADMSGDGLADIVRVRASEVCYWPNLGYGRFGRKVTLDGVPSFDSPDTFEPRRVLFADLDGSGTSDIVYLGREGVRIHINQAGNALGRSVALRSLPPADPLSHVDVVDLLGTGTPCLVWSSVGPAYERRPVAYVDVMGSTKPHLLTTITNNVGAETRIRYASSTEFFLRDREAGRPWLTRLPFPVHVVSRVEHIDHIAETVQVSRRAYHHGYFDGSEREFRGFACVEQWDAESFSGARGGGPYDTSTEVEHRPPIRTVQWFHTGAWLDREQLDRELAREYFAGDRAAPRLPPIRLPRGVSAQEEREALRALRGKPIREEVYADDDTEASTRPYTVVQHDYHLTLLEQAVHGSHAVVFARARSTTTLHYERFADDPRMGQELVLEVDAFGNVTRTATLAYPRRRPEEPEQERFLVSLTERDVANITNGGRRLGIPIEERVWEITGMAATSPLSVDDIAAAVTTLPRRIRTVMRTTYFESDGRSSPRALPHGQVDVRALVHETYRLALTEATIADAFGDRVDHAVFSEGGYVRMNVPDRSGQRLDLRGAWWIPSGRAVPDPTAFFLPIAFVDAFGNITRLRRDTYALLTESIADPVGNVVHARNDYRVLAPTMLTDANGNRDAVAVDPLGLVIATAAMGKEGADEGDTLASPTTELSYDLLRWKRSGGTLPTFVRTRTREQHGPSNTRWQETYTYSDGSSRVAMTKARAEPGLAPLRHEGRLVTDEHGRIVARWTAERWVGSGKKVFDNKGSIVKEYEPFFSSTFEYEGEDELRKWGVASVSYYDPPGRLVRVELPHGGVRRNDVTPWGQTTYDENDTVLDQGNRWLAARATGASPPARREELRAAELTVAHAKTPSVTKLDPLGRVVLVIDQLGEADGWRKLSTRTELDIEGRPFAIVDAGGRVCTRYVRGSDGQVLRETSIDAGETRLLNDVSGKPLRSWDSLGRRRRTTYDAQRRPTHLHVLEAGHERVAVRTIYGEEEPAPEDRNLRGQPAYTFDEAGAFHNERYDLDGNLTHSSRILAASTDEPTDWAPLDEGRGEVAGVLEAASHLLESERFTKRFVYDALHRVARATFPDGSTIHPRYSVAGLLDAVDVVVGGASTPIVTAIEHDAKGRRSRIAYGNGTSSAYTYDPLTFRLTRLVTAREHDGATLQDLRYTYDCLGNVVAIADRAQQTLFFAGEEVAPSASYEYDALYRLRTATGREHRGLGGHAPGASDSEIDELPHANDARALRRYEEQFTYDGVGNLLEMVHDAGEGSWSRRYAYAPGSNRLSATSAPGDERGGTLSAKYRHDENGNMVAAPNLAAVRYTHANQMSRVDLGGGGRASYAYDAAGVRVRKFVRRSGLTEERIYLGGFEIYRKRDISGLLLERQTLHVMDDAQRVALIETKTTDRRGSKDVGAPRARYQYDNHLGSALLECDEAGLAITYEEFHPFGTSAYRSARSGLDVSEKRYRYTGKERDEETGLYYHGARYYAAWLGRWTSADPAGMVDGPNRYAYVNDRVMNAVDPDGRQSIFTVVMPQSPVPQPRTAWNPPPPPPPPPPQEALEQAAKLHGQTVGRIDTLEREIGELYTSRVKGAPIRFWSLDHFFAAAGFGEPIVERGQQLDDLVDAGVAERGSEHWHSTVYLHAVEAGIITNQADQDRFLQIAEAERQTVVLKWAAWRAFEMVLALTPAKGGGAGGALFARAPAAEPAALNALNSAAKASGVTGKWVNVVESMSERAIAFQELVSGGIKAGASFLRNGVKFDFLDVARKVLIDAKGPGYANFVKADGTFYNWFEGAKAMVEQAKRQKTAANGLKIEWVFKEQKALDATKALFKDKNVTWITLRLY